MRISLTILSLHYRIYLIILNYRGITWLEQVNLLTFITTDWNSLWFAVIISSLPTNGTPPKFSIFLILLINLIHFIKTKIRYLIFISLRNENIIFNLVFLLNIQPDCNLVCQHCPISFTNLFYWYLFIIVKKFTVWYFFIRLYSMSNNLKKRRF